MQEQKDEITMWLSTHTTHEVMKMLKKLKKAHHKFMKMFEKMPMVTTIVIYSVAFDGTLNKLHYMRDHLAMIADLLSLWKEHKFHGSLRQIGVTLKDLWVFIRASKMLKGDCVRFMHEGEQQQSCEMPMKEKMEKSEKPWTKKPDTPMMAPCTSCGAHSPQQGGDGGNFMMENPQFSMGFLS